ncbi:alpha-amylase family glycosyl hydrolase [Microbulbifer elongatus]|uniref:alpha-amylase family glycosyl hydrolase n=1 Tax=Microbulbifer elongatus TaxID=86173 RepID=UPI001CFDB21C|nr:alpha-amylase family glycosyl hydrolase [Microbulbifer elongatus]
MKTIKAMMGSLILASSCSAVSAETPRTAFVHLFEWQWDDVAAECENVLGPKGFSAVQVSPPQKSINAGEWWARYQPVSYQIEGRSGSRAQFASMVNRCKAAGVDIYVDAVINHMAAWDRNFPEVPYGPNDFHNCTSDIDYGNAWSIQNCDLVGLNDLKTESDYVQQKIADYLNDLTSLGVAGFRIDAAKHMPAADINAIKNRLTGNPYIFQEVIGAGGEPVKPTDYNWIGDVTEFNFTNTLGHYFKLRGPLREISNIGTWSDWLPSEDAVVFVANHDNQRQNTDNTITHKDGNNANNMAHVFMLGWPYGYPKVM